MTYRAGFTQTLIAAGAFVSVCAADVLIFPEHPKTISAETLPYSQMLHTGVEDGAFHTRGRFGADFPFIGYRFGGGDSGGSRQILSGITAAAHINMLPKSGGMFPVDNFYAVLALNFSGNLNEKLAWRLYPVYHVSAHLADGYPADIIKDSVRPVSSEMVRGELYYKPFGEILELGAGAGWYYHVCAQKDLRYRADVSVLLTKTVPVLNNNSLRPYLLIRAENVRQGGNNPGIDVSAGIIALSGRRGFGLSIRYFNRLHSGYYFDEYERGWGAEYTFIY